MGGEYVDQTAFIMPSLVITVPYTVTNDAIQSYLDLITSQHKTKPNFNSWLASTLGAVYDGISATESINTAFDIDNAVGSQLDVIGDILGRSRHLPFQPSNGSSPTLSDDNYRIALKAKVVQNGWDGTITSIYSIWYSLFSDITMNIVDNQNMTMSVLIDSDKQMDPVITEMIAAGYIVPKPAGVGLIIIEVTKVFENQYIAGWVTTNETMTLSQTNIMIYENNYVGALITTNEIMSISQ
jgi:hypothetical protein